MFERLESRTPAAALFYAIDVAAGDQVAPDVVRPGDRLRVVATGRAEAADVFAFGFDLTYNAQFLRLVDRGVAAEFQTAASVGTLIEGDAIGTNRIDDVGGVLSDLAFDQAGGVVELAWFEFLVEPAGDVGPIGLTGVALDVDQVDSFFESLGRGIDDALEARATHPTAAGFVDNGRSAFWLANVERAVELHNAESPADVDGDGRVSPRDALVVVNDYDAHGERSIDQAAAEGSLPDHQVDANDDGRVGQPADVFVVFAALNQGAEG